MKVNYSKASTKKLTEKEDKKTETKKTIFGKKEEVVKKEIKGKVINCQSLYVRQEGNKKSEPLTDIKNGEIVEVYEDNARDFYKVKTKKGIEGYCMKKYIEII